MTVPVIVSLEHAEHCIWLLLVVVQRSARYNSIASSELDLFRRAKEKKLAQKEIEIQRSIPFASTASALKV